ncbi:uncharacterized protein LOC125104166 isoform X1 [Lutra lutra]|uniref:uncharacterized protein LOC125104166 isoform X1 n=1 Tax=Lutra lutra TaxID=9657 RepID=UPI001FD2E1B3|nr:uncharacterized protein LOC125104166 isoform X1 [Lutra lutra]
MGRGGGEARGVEGREGRVRRRHRRQLCERVQCVLERVSEKVSAAPTSREEGPRGGPGRARGGPTPDARWHREAGPSGMAVLEQMEGWSLSLSCVKTSSANWLTLNGETGRTTHVFHFGFESQKTGFLQKPFGFNKCSVLNVNGSKPNTQDFCVRSRSEGLHVQVLREYLKLDSKARFTTDFEVEEGCSLLIWMLLSKFLQPWYKNMRKHGIVAITEAQ